MLNALKEKAHMTAVEHGFYEEVKPDAFYLGLVMSEAGEAINADRKGMHADTKRFEELEAAEKGFTFAENFRAYIKDSVEDEIADIVIRLLDFAGHKWYGLRYERDYELTNPAFWVLEHEGLSSALFKLNYALGNAYDRFRLEEGISCSIMIYSECFGKMTGSDKDLWWFVEQKMRYNDLRPRLNGKKY
jgi:hypothetical protein